MSKREQRRGQRAIGGGSESGSDTPSLDELAAAGYGDLAAQARQIQKRLDFVADGTLQIGRITMTRVGIQPDTEMTLEEFSNLGEILLTLEGSLQWLLGDWLAYGENNQWGKTAHELAEAVGRNVDSLYTYTWVCRKVDFSIRIENLYFGHHQLVASMESREQRRWLEQAEANQWSVTELRNAINPPAQKGTATIWERSPMKVPNLMVKLWNRARSGDDDARQEALEMVATQRRWLDEYETGLNV